MRRATEKARRQMLDVELAAVRNGGTGPCTFEGYAYWVEPMMCGNKKVVWRYAVENPAGEVSICPEELPRKQQWGKSHALRAARELILEKIEKEGRFDGS